VPPVDLYIESSIPIGVGLSSSAALEVATLRALNALCAAQVDDLAIALMAQRAEIKHAGVKCGVMDPMAASFADIGSMLFIDTRTLDRKLLPLPQGTEIAVIDSGVARSLASSKYNERRAQCERAAELLHMRALRDVSQVALLRDLPEPLLRRARHVVTENQRVLLAADGIDGKGFGELMNASHHSLRDDFEVSVPPVDSLVQSLQHQSGIYGARLTGAGFGGACVALCRQGEAHALASAALAEFNAANHRGRILVPGGQSISQ
jgi:galactokinase